MRNWIFLIVIIVSVASFFIWQKSKQFNLPKGETIILNDKDGSKLPDLAPEEAGSPASSGAPKTAFNKSMIRNSKREVLVTDGVKHSIPLGEILSGGPAKDGIPSIDKPKFIKIQEADKKLRSDAIGLGIIHKNEARFYPYQILVWHEIVNDKIQGDPILITYCPLCLTGIVFERRVGDIEQEFGVSGKLWKSNLLMYNRASSEKEESLWSQVLGEAVLGINTGEKLKIMPSDTVKYGEWKSKNPDTRVLSEETGSIRSYGADPYGDYYTSESVSFGATFNDQRLHPKAFVLGIEINSKFKAYHKEALPEGKITDDFAGEKIRITKSKIGEVRMFVGADELPYISGFWFSWLSVHPQTELFK